MPKPFDRTQLTEIAQALLTTVAPSIKHPLTPARMSVKQELVMGWVSKGIVLDQDNPFWQNAVDNFDKPFDWGATQPKKSHTRALASLIECGWVDVVAVAGGGWRLREGVLYTEAVDAARAIVDALRTLMTSDPLGMGSIDWQRKTRPDAKLITKAKDFRRFVAEPSRWGMNGVHWGPSDTEGRRGRSVLTATNGHTLAQAVVAVEYDNGLPDRHLLQISEEVGGTWGKLLSWTSEVMTDEVLAGALDVEGEFPDYKQLLDQPNHVYVDIDPRELLALLGAGTRPPRKEDHSGKAGGAQYPSLIDSKGLAYRNPCTGANLLASMTWHDSDGRESVDLSWGRVRVGFNSGYLREVVQFMDVGAPLRIKMQIDRRGEPMALVPLLLEQYDGTQDSHGVPVAVRRALLMPMRVG